MAKICFDKNGMTRNPAKYQAMIMGKTQELPKFSCDNIAIPITNEIELLGVTVDDKLKFENHIRKLCRKVSQQTAVLQRMKKMLPFETKRDLYFAFILPHFNYCTETWHRHCSKKCTSMLEKVNERAVRFIFNALLRTTRKTGSDDTPKSKTLEDSLHRF